MWAPFRFIGRRLARFLSEPRPIDFHPATSAPQLLREAIRPGDVLLVEGTSRLSGAIKYLTQSTWSHAALHVGDAVDGGDYAGEPRVLVEADVNDGVRAVPLGLYADQHTRICRPVGLTDGEREQLIDYMVSRIGHQYDLRNIFDLARYLIRTPPVPDRWKRRMIALGSGDPTRAICSSLIAQAFQSIRYPILPHVEVRSSDNLRATGCREEVHHIRHHSLYAPRDFDVSPWFEVIKPHVAAGFDFRDLVWAEGSETPPAAD